MSETTKRQFVPSQAHLTQIHIPREPDSQLTYREQLLEKIEAAFAEKPEATELLIGIDLQSFEFMDDQTKLTADLHNRGMTYQVVSRGNRHFENCGAHIVRINPNPEEQ